MARSASVEPQNGEQTMTSAADQSPTTSTYELTCTDCEFEATVEGTPFDVLDVADAHQAEHGDAPSDHFVNCTLTDDRE